MINVPQGYNKDVYNKLEFDWVEIKRIYEIKEFKKSFELMLKDANAIYDYENGYIFFDNKDPWTNEFKLGCSIVGQRWIHPLISKMISYDEDEVEDMTNGIKNIKNN